MKKMNAREVITILAHAFVVWVVCGATMGIGMAATSLENTLTIHVVVAPVIAAIVSLVYFKKFNHTTPLQTAILFLSFVVFMDVFVVALVILRSFEMFASIPGTWLPFALIFLATYVTGLYTAKPA